MMTSEGYYVYCTEYRHYRTGKIMKASDYGRTAWRFWVHRKKK